ncbi:uracil phosphoribosyltransferase [Raphidocelis subcapitata]|uniref:uracil phosphoribosyltransferase n=1 Tax=Raphidocelis subcapitata TaxID=307507 RepID=A0A2V0PCT0_9CHLO|nr:uracil phosphoribosyltransferase [Raphidocelis subcapitata]|eukprot:GBF97658.1 uracil phosphoribosyltransferase [Raphidocelis subcapitata]
MLVYVPPHPLVKHWLAIARNAATPPSLFRSACAELGRILIYEAVREFLPTVETTVDTPVGPADVEFVDPTKPIKVVPILRAGLVLLEQAGTVLPMSETYHVGYVRDETTLKATPYLNKLPASLSPDDKILITDPMLATGGTMLQVIEDIVARGADPANIRIVCVVAAPGYIVPGLGDAGDRAFGTSG